MATFGCAGRIKHDLAALPLETGQEIAGGATKKRRDEEKVAFTSNCEKAKPFEA